MGMFRVIVASCTGELIEDREIQVDEPLEKFVIDTYFRHADRHVIVQTFPMDSAAEWEAAEMHLRQTRLKFGNLPMIGALPSLN